MRVVIQHRQRFFRDGLAMVLGAEPDVTVVATAATDRELLEACRRERPDAVVFELDVDEWDPLALVGSLRRVVRAVRLVATGARVGRVRGAQAVRAGVWAVVAHDRGVAGILEALRSGERPPVVASLPTDGAGAPQPRLTAREREVLMLVAAGHTGREIAASLGISAKTVENHKQRIFAKLGVQNQAHAIAVAMRAGILDVGPADRSPGLAGLP
jgi:DNA-binding NarL/FixJ family response regulator